MSTPGRRPYREFGSWLRTRRLARRWTQEELAGLLAYDVTYVRKIEWGERRPSEPFRVRLAQALGLPLSGLPPSSPVARPRIPSPATPLIGRAKEAEIVAELLQGGGARLVTLLGAPGIGKTRLAIEVASRLDDKLPGRVCFVSLLSVTDPGGVADAIAGALGIPVPAGSASVEPLVDGLRAQEALLVLDNFEHLAPAASLVGQLLSNVPSLRVLATSREALGLVAETQYWMPPLALPDRDSRLPAGELARVPAIALFVARARSVRPDFELTEETAPAVAEICARLGGVPLAIELAAGASRLLPPKTLLDRLGHGLDLPVSGSKDAPQHHRTLRAAIGWSYQLLNPWDRTLLARLGVFVGGCTLEAAVAVCDMPDEPSSDPAAGLLSLVGKSLLDPMPEAPGGPRFVALEAVREFALEQLCLRDEVERCKSRHAAYFVELAEAGERRLTGAEQAEWLRVLEAEHGNLQAALRWSLESDPDLAIRLAGALWRFWWIRGHLGEGRHWLEAVLARGRRGTVEEVRAVNGAGVLARTQGAYGAAQRLLEEGASLARAIGDDEGLALSLINLGIVAENQADYERAAALFEESRCIYAVVGDQRGVGHALNDLGLVHLAQGVLDAAASSFHDSLAIFREVSDEWSIAMVSTNLGWVAHKQGRNALARSLYEQNLGVYRALGDERGLANTMSNLSVVALDEGDPGTAAGLLEEALLTFRRLGDRQGVAECLGHFAVVKATAGDERLAARLFGTTDALRESMGAPLGPSERGGLDRVVGTVRSQLGPDAFCAEWDHGRLLSLDEAIAIVLTRRRPALSDAGAHPAPKR